MRVLLAVDGSESSTYAADAVGFLDSVESVTVLHVIDLPRLGYPMLGPDVGKDLGWEIEQAIREEGAQVLQRTMSQMAHHPFQILKRLEEGTPSELVLSVAEEEHADMIVLGSRGVGQVHEFFLGSVSHQVLTHAACSVCIVNTPVGQIERILIPVQGFEDVERAKQVLLKHPFADHAEMTVFTVVPIPRSIFRAGVSASETKVQRALESAEEFIDAAVGELKECSYAVVGLFGLGDPAGTILEQAAQSKSDLILMGAHHPSAVTRIVLGSVSHTVLHRTQCPVMLIRGKRNGYVKYPLSR